jgi:hypothetical protein
MATLGQTATRTIFVHPDLDSTNHWPTHRLLADLGHDVTSILSLDDAVRAMHEDPVDLLVIEEPARADAALRERCLQQIRSLPLDKQPLEVAIFSDRPAPPDASRHHGTPRVHVLLKPLHVHGLLHVIRHLRSRATMSAAAS